MKFFRLLLTFQLIALCALLSAQTLSVESFRLLENDLTANTYGTMERDQNGEVAALIRVVTPEKGFVFDGGMMGIVATKQDVGEILVYVPHGLQKITIKHEQLGILRDYYFPVPIEKARTYEMKLLSGRLKTVVDDQLSAQFVIFHVTPANATVTIDGVSHIAETDGNVTQLLSYGDHEYRVELPGYNTDAGTITVGSEKITKEIVLTSSKAKITLNCSMEEAEIWVNEQRYGQGSWTGELAAGMYMVEVKRDGYQTRNMAITVSENEERTYTVPEPIPVYGHIQVQSTPIDATIFIDDVEVGQTPHLQGNVQGGNHKVTVRKEGYLDYETYVLVEDSKVAQVSARLVQNGQVPAAGNASRRRQTDTQTETAVTEKTDDRLDINKLREDVVNIKVPNYKKSCFYLGGMYVPGKLAAYGAQLGFYVGNFNVQGELGFHERSIQGYWISLSTDLQDKTATYAYDWKFNYTASGVIGFGIGIGHTMRLTPQAGFSVTQLKSINDELFQKSGDKEAKNTFYAGAVAAFKLEWIPSKHLSLFAAPSYMLPLKEGEIADYLDKNDKSVSKYADGFKVSMGLNVVF